MIKLLFPLLIVNICSCISCSNNGDRSVNQYQDSIVLTTISVSGDIDTSEVKNNRSSDLLSFKCNIINWTPQELATRQQSNPVSFHIISQEQLSDTLLKVVLDGVQNSATYSGNVLLQGDRIRLFYWTNAAVGKYVKYELVYEIRVPEKRNYEFKISKLKGSIYGVK